MSHPIPPPPISAPPPRSTTAPQSQSPTTHRHHIHRPHRSHPHRHHHHAHHARDRSIPQSALLPTSSNPFKDNSLGDLLSPITSRLHESGRHEDGPDRLEEKELLLKKEKEERERQQERERKTWTEVEARRRARGDADAALTTTLTTLSTVSTTQTRRLDYTHYSLLSHLSSLGSTLALLSSLSHSTATHLGSFEASASDTVAQAEAQLASFEEGVFAGMRERAGGLDKRVKEARRRVRGLEGRVRELVVVVESGEREEGRRERGRRWWLWGCVVGVGVVAAGIVGMVGGKGVGREGYWDGRLMDKVGWDVGAGAGGGVGGLEQMMNTTVMVGRGGERQGGEEVKTAKVRTADEWEPRLRMLEEL
ncbi:MAG: hypothetical protein LQ338_004452 [Usnochroma carphineum]|nr:MAG: hypothetical protein LQ338_004452 [Usnochroma carphineum]